MPDRIDAYALAVALLDHLGPGPVDRSALADDEYERWVDAVLAVEDYFEGGGDGVLTGADLRWIDTTQPRGLGESAWLHAVAWGVDLSMWQIFPQQWHEYLGQPGSHRLADGEPYPVSDWLAHPQPGLGYSVRPSAEGVRLGELPHIRRWSMESGPGSDPVGVEFHFTAHAEVRAAAEADVVATIHVNESSAEFAVPASASAYPVRPTPADQAERIISLLGRCQVLGAGVVVGGEVSLTPEVLLTLQNWVDQSWTAPPLLVPGSVHALTGREPSNIALALRRKLPPLEHRKIVPFEQSTSTQTAPRREGIVPGPRTLKVWVGDWARFSILICRDLLDASVRSAVIRAGVNLLAVPAFSDEMSSYPVHVGEVSLASQGRVIVANNPARFDEATVLPNSVFGQPVRNRSSQSAVSAGSDDLPKRGISVDRIGEDPIWLETS